MEFAKALGEGGLALLGLGRWGGGAVLNTLSHIFPSKPIHGFARSNYSQWKERTDLSENVRIHRAEDYRRKVLNRTDVKIVFIATESNSHYRFAKEALLAGKDVLVEKPISKTKEEARDLIEIAKKQKRILAVGYELMFDLSVHLLKIIMEDSQYKAVNGIELNLLNPLAGRKLDFTSNVIEDFVPHLLSILHVLMDRKDVSDLHVEMGLTREQGSIAFQYGCTKISIHVDRDYKEALSNRAIIVTGPDYVIEADLLNNTFGVKNRKGVILDRHDERFPPSLLQQAKDDSSPLEREYKEFLECVRTRQLPRNAAEFTCWIPDIIHRMNEQFMAATKTRTRCTKGSTSDDQRLPVRLFKQC